MDNQVQHIEGQLIVQLSFHKETCDICHHSIKPSSFNGHSKDLNFYWRYTYTPDGLDSQGYNLCESCKKGHF